MGKKKEQYCPLTRWQYFTKTLYHDPSSTGEFTYDGVVYRKSEALQTVESRNSRLQMGLVGLMFLAFVLATYFRSAMPLAAGILLIVAGSEPSAQGHPVPPHRHRTEGAVMDALQVIARIHTELPEKFGVPRQSGLVPQLRGRIVFEPAYRNPDAVRGLEDFSHLWLIWQFSEAVRQDWSPTVRPPRLGGNRRMGVFATRSPFRPNHLGLSSVRLERVEQSEALGPVLHVCGADLMDGTPIFDIKPYLPYTDSHPDAVGGFTDGLESRCLRVECPPRLLECIPADSREGLLGVLAGDPRPRYQEDPQRVYGMGFAGQNVRFTVDGETLTVHSIDPLEK